MKSERKAAINKKINPNFWIFCEGKTEATYIRYLRSEYRLPVEIIPKIAGSVISARYIKSYKNGKPVHKKDMDFLVYDADVPDVLVKLRTIPSAILIASNPAIELWFLLHYKNQTAAITANECVREIFNRSRHVYEKGFINERLKQKLKENCREACVRANKLQLFNNPSTNMHVFIDELEKAKDAKL